MDEPEEYIDFMAKYGDWISIKRLGIRGTTRREEVVHHLAGIRSAIEGRSYPLLGIKTDALDQYASRVCSGMRKSYGSLSSAISKLDSQEARRAIADSCEKGLAPIAEAYLLGKVVTDIGYDTGINQITMSKLFPGLKLPKAPGMKRAKKSR